MDVRRAPCMGCEDRTAGCHATCERFRTYRAHIDAQRERRSHDAEERDMVIREVQRTKKRRGCR